MPRDFDLPLEMQKMRSNFIADKIRSKVLLSSNDYEYLLRGINKDIYDAITGLDVINNFRFRALLDINLGLTYILPKRSSFKEAILIGKKNIKISHDNYKRVFAGVDIVNQNQTISNIDTLIDQLYYAEKYNSALLNYINDLKAKILTKYFDGTFYLMYQSDMKESRDKVLTLEKKYVNNDDIKK